MACKTNGFPSYPFHAHERIDLEANESATYAYGKPIIKLKLPHWAWIATGSWLVDLFGLEPPATFRICKCEVLLLGLA